MATVIIGAIRYEVQDPTTAKDKRDLREALNKAMAAFPGTVRYEHGQGATTAEMVKILENYAGA